MGNCNEKQTEKQYLAAIKGQVIHYLLVQQNTDHGLYKKGLVPIDKLFQVNIKNGKLTREEFHDLVFELYEDYNLIGYYCCPLKDRNEAIEAFDWTLTE